MNERAPFVTPAAGDVLIYDGLTEATVFVEGYDDETRSVFRVEVRADWATPNLLQHMRQFLTAERAIRRQKGLRLIP